MGKLPSGAIYYICHLNDLLTLSGVGIFGNFYNYGGTNAIWNHTGNIIEGGYFFLPLPGAFFLPLPEAFLFTPAGGFFFTPAGGFSFYPLPGAFLFTPTGGLLPPAGDLSRGTAEPQLLSSKYAG